MTGVQTCALPISLTPSADAPLLPEWTDWAGRYETLDDVWSACRTPELLVFILGHAVRLQYVGNPDAVRDGLERFVAWCADLAGLDPQEVAGPSSGLDEASPRWFARTGTSLFGRARRVASAAERAAVGDNDASAGREFRQERTEQARLLRSFVGNPFFGARVAEHAPADPPEEPVGALSESEVSVEPGSGADGGAEPAGMSGQPELLLAPAHRGSWGVVTRLAGPPDPEGATGAAAAALRQADCSLQIGRAHV